MFDVELGSDRDINSLAGNLYLEPLSVFYGVRQTPQLRHKVGLWIFLFHISFWLSCHISFPFIFLSLMGCCHTAHNNY